MKVVWREKMCTSNSRVWRYEEKKMEIGGKVLTAFTTVKQITQAAGRTTAVAKCTKMKNTGAKHAKLLFFVVKCTRSCRHQAPKRPCPRHTCVQNVTRVEWFSLHGRVRFCGWYDELRSYLTENLSSTRFKEVSNDYSSILFLKKNYETRGDKNLRKRLWSVMFSHRVTM